LKGGDVYPFFGRLPGILTAKILALPKRGGIDEIERSGRYRHKEEFRPAWTARCRQGVLSVLPLFCSGRPARKLSTVRIEVGASNLWWLLWMPSRGAVVDEAPRVRHLSQASAKRHHRLFLNSRLAVFVGSLFAVWMVQRRRFAQFFPPFGLGFSYDAKEIVLFARSALTVVEYGGSFPLRAGQARQITSRENPEIYPRSARLALRSSSLPGETNL